MKTHVSINLRAIVLAASFIMLAASFTWGQNQQSTSSSSAPSDSQSSKADGPAETASRPNTDSYAVSLGTGQVISLGNSSSNDTSQAQYDDGRRTNGAGNDLSKQFFYGSSVAGFYSHGFDQTGRNTQVTSSTVDPYVGVLVPTRTGSYLIQYAPVIDPNDNGQLEAYHNMALTAQGALTRRLYWSFGGGGSYGSANARAQGSLGYLVVGGIPTVNTSSAASLFPGKNVAFGNTNISLIWLMSQREKITVTQFYTYSAVQGTHITPGDVGTHDNAIGSVVAYSRAYSERVILRAYGQTSFILNLPLCNTFGGGAGIDIKFKHDVVLDVQGGPERNSAACGGQQNVNFSGSLTANLKKGNSVYITGNRVFTTAYRTTGRWEDNVAVGLAKSMRALFAIAEAGYLRSPGLSATIPEYQGYFIAPRITCKITESLGLSTGYRVFRSQGGGLATGNLHFATISLDWHPSALRF